MRRKGSQTSMLVVVALLSLCCSATALEAITLTIKELRKVIRDDDPSGGQQNIKVIVDKHDPIEADDYVLLLFGNSGQIPYPCASLPDPKATEILFEGNFVDATGMFVTAKKGGDSIAVGSLSVDIKDPGSRVALVGSSDAPSLRVDPGEREQVEVPGRVPCVKGSGPCYYLGQGGDPLTPPELCEEINGLKFCDDIVSNLLDSEDPTVELHNREKLIVGSEPRTEVVVSAPGGGDPLSEDFVCNDNGDGTCSYSHEVGDAEERFNVMVVVLDEEGYVTGSALVDFEVHGLSTSWLAEDVLQVSINPLSTGTYKVEVLGSSTVEAQTECESETECRVWLGEVESTDSVKVWKGNAGVSQDLETGTPPTASTVKSITSSDAKTSLKIESSTTVTKVDLITFSDHFAFDEDHLQLEATATESGYTVESPQSVSGEWEFVVAGYTDDGTLLESAHAVVTLLDLSRAISVVGAPLNSPGASVRVDVGELKEIVVEGLGSCVQAESPCYFLGQTLEGATSIMHCVDIENSAGDDAGNVTQCDGSFTPFEAMNEPELELANGDSLIVTAAGTTGKTLEVLVFDSENADETLIDGSPVCSRKDDLSCTQGVNIPEGVQDLQVLVVAVGESGAVTESVFTPFCDLKTSFSVLSAARDLEVSWRSPKEESFSVRVDIGGASGRSNVLSVTCGGSAEEATAPCKAYFTDLDSVDIRKVEVKVGTRAVSVSTPISEGNATFLHINRISQTSNSRLEIAFSSDAEVQDVVSMEFVVISPSGNQNIAAAKFPADIMEEGNTMEFDANIPDPNTNVKLLLVAHREEDGASDAFGKALAKFKDIVIPRLTKVGSEELESLKVETSSMEVEVNGETCPPDTVCYFLEPGTFPEPPEVCRKAAPEVEQCDMTTNYLSPHRLIDPVIELAYDETSEQYLIVTAPFNENSVAMEILVYNDSALLTPTPVICDINKNKETSCNLQMENHASEFKILLSALDEKSNVTETNAIEFEDYQTQVQQLTADTIEVRWRGGSESAAYHVTVHPEIEGGSSSLSVQCGGESSLDGDLCVAYFIRLESGVEYKATVSKTGDNRGVAALFAMNNFGDDVLKISSLKLIGEEDGTMNLGVCFRDEKMASDERREWTKDDSLYAVAVTDTKGLQLLKLSSANSSVLCLDPLSIGQDFDTVNEIYVVVKRDIGNGYIAAGWTTVYLMYPHGAVDVDQIGSKELRISWVNRNNASNFEVEAGNDTLALEVEGIESCLRYLHPSVSGSRVVVTLREVGVLEQESLFTIRWKDLKEISITQTDLNREGHLRVCFEPIADPAEYFLGLEDDEHLVQEFKDLLPDEEDGLTCVHIPVEIKAAGYVSFRTILSAFKNDVIMASRTKAIGDFFLSSNRRVNAAVDKLSSQLWVSWFILDNPKSINNYTINLEKTSGVIHRSSIVSNTETTIVFEGVGSGRYSACVAASVEEEGSVFQSKQVCSAIISVLDEDVDVPEIPNTAPMSAGEDKIFVTWEKPNDADINSYTITWAESPQGSLSSRKRDNRMRPRQLLPVAQIAPRAADESFVILPASSNSVEIEGLVVSKNYRICVAAVKEDVRGATCCNDLDLGKHTTVSSPDGLEWSDEGLQWNAVDSVTRYLVEWRTDVERETLPGGLIVAEEPRWTAKDVLPGDWEISVMAEIGTSVSDPSIKMIKKNGIVITATQRRNGELTVSWREDPAPTCAEDFGCKYQLMASNSTSTYYCSGKEGDCRKTLRVSTTAAHELVTVEVARDDIKSPIKYTVTATLYQFPDIPELRLEFSDGNKMVNWTGYKGANLYNVTLFTDYTLSSIRYTDMISTEFYVLPSTDLEENVFLVQPCEDKKHCGDPAKINVAEDTEKDKTVSIVGVSILGGVMLAAIVVFVVAVVTKMVLVKREEKDEIRRTEEAVRRDPPIAAFPAEREGRRFIPVVSLPPLKHQQYR